MLHEKKRLLIIDDDKFLCMTIRDCFSSTSHVDDPEVHIANTAREGVAFCRAHRVDVVLLDQRLPDGEGHTFCPQILANNDQCKIIFITAFPSFDNATKAIRYGAHDYLAKPFQVEELRHVIKRVLRTTKLEHIAQLHSLQEKQKSQQALLVGTDPRFLVVQQLVHRAAQENAPVLITGETGTGKTTVAKAIHRCSPIADSAFVGFNCAAVPEALMEAELFGSEKGAFTGADHTHKGLFEMADGGVLFLDEIGAMPSSLQAKLLHVLEEKKIKRLGADSFRCVNFRIISATNADLETEIKTRTFRQDLFYRLDVIRIHIPPLREHISDLPQLCREFIRQMPCRRTVHIDENELERLSAYSWPGNVRELKNVLERSIILQDGEALKPSEFLHGRFDEPAQRDSSASGQDSIVPLHEVEKQHIRAALTRCDENRTRTAKALGISLSTLKRKIQKYSLPSL